MCRCCGAVGGRSLGNGNVGVRSEAGREEKLGLGNRGVRLETEMVKGRGFWNGR